MSDTEEIMLASSKPEEEIKKFMEECKHDTTVYHCPIDPKIDHEVNNLPWVRIFRLVWDNIKF